MVTHSKTTHTPSSRWVLVGLGVLLLLLLGAFAVLDLPISRATYHPESRWADLLREYGELPGHLLVLLSAGLYLWLGRKRILRILMLLPIVLETFVFATQFGLPHTAQEGAFVIAIAAVPIGVILIALRIRAREQMARSAGLVVLAATLHPLVLVQSLKLLWGRIRFRHLQEDALDFSPWYLPRGYTGNESFPSGHAAMGVLLCFLVLYLPRPQRWMAFVPLLAWAVAVGTSRVVLGAHYPSDVAFSLFVGLMLLEGFAFWMNRRERDIAPI